MLAHDWELRDFSTYSFAFGLLKDWLYRLKVSKDMNISPETAYRMGKTFSYSEFRNPEAIAR